MTGQFFLDWAVMAVSLLNIILMLWLGLTVMLNAERRTWGIWLAGGGLLLGEAFFVSHSAIAGNGLNFFSQGVNFWWRVGLWPVIALPIVWYEVVLWYTGYWERKGARYGFVLTLLLTGVMIVLLIFGLVVYFIVKDPKRPGDKGIFEGIREELGKYVHRP